MYAIALLLLLSPFMGRTSVEACNGGPSAPPYFKQGMNLGVHVFTDVNFTRHFNTSDEVQQCVLRFFKSVFLRFRSAHRNLTLHLVNITILNDTKVEDNCFVYHDHSTQRLLKPFTLKYVDLNQSMAKFKKCMKNTSSGAYLSEQAPIIYVLTGYDTAMKLGNEWKRWPGSADKQGGVCSESNLAIGPDKPGTFLGILSAVRLIGYLLGSQYDGWRDNEHTRATDCHRVNHHVMSYYEDVAQSHKFSSCSLTEMETRLKNYTCDKARTKKVTIGSDVKYPGEDMTREMQFKVVLVHMFGWMSDPTCKRTSGGVPAA
ncbi:uncharacterized protein LOC135373791 isoform X2 [Ornithodoros turicata]|uniref:uncharacterized protein LOC135373791 isoform X2 n=1 Tax=Ornithodoros turicata TaxID=34597 RepID=UPI0031388D95